MEYMMGLHGTNPEDWGVLSDLITIKKTRKLQLEIKTINFLNRIIEYLIYYTQLKQSHKDNLIPYTSEWDKQN